MKTDHSRLRETSPARVYEVQANCFQTPKSAYVTDYYQFETVTDRKAI